MRVLTISAIALCAGAAWAVPFARPGCQTSGYDRGMQNLVHKIAVIGSDDRVPLSRFARRLNWNRSKAARVSKLNGEIKCTDTRGNVTEFSGAVVGTQYTLLTAAHSFFDPVTNVRRDFVDCVFESQATSPRVGPITVNLERSHIAASHRDDHTKDWAVLRLSTGMGDFFAVDPSGAALEEKEYIQVAARHEDLPATGEPYAQTCSRREVWARRGSNASLILSDCDSTAISSGSTFLVDSSDQLIAVGVLTGGGNPSRNGQPYSRAGATHSLAIDAEMIDVIYSVGGRVLQTAGANP